jgi:hypothetical protein
MKLKAPEGVGDPCVAGTLISARDGLYEVEPEIGAVLMECFGFVEIDMPGLGSAPAPRRLRQPRKSRPRKLKAEE